MALYVHSLIVLMCR